MSRRFKASKYFLIIFTIGGIFLSWSGTLKVYAQTGGISGKVTFDRINPAPYVPVLVTQTGNQTETVPIRAVTNSKGIYSISGLSIGTYKVQVISSYFKPSVIQEIKVIDSQINEVNFELTIIRACSESLGDNISLTDSDRAEIVGWLLQNSLIQSPESEIQSLIKNKKEIFLSTNNVKSSWIPKFSKFRIQLLDENAIQQLANRKGDFQYMEISREMVTGSCVAVAIGRNWAAKKNTGLLYLDGSLTFYEFTKISGKWTGKVYSKLIS